MPASPATVHLVDASPYVFRAFFSLPDSIRDPEGRPIHAAYGFASFLLKLLEDESPTHVALAFDGSLTTSFRNEFYPPYKSSRPEPPPELVAQLDACRDLGAALGIACFIDDRYEADDLIATLLARLRAEGHRAVVVSNDKDLAQLVEPEVAFYDFARGERYGPAEVAERFGVRPDQIPDLLGLAGDPVDDIPGVPGVGKKTACALLAEVDTLEAALADLDRVAGLPIRGAASLAGRLDEHRDQALLSRRLAVASTEAPVEAGLDELAYEGAGRQAVEEVFGRLGFGKIRDRVKRWKD